MTGFDMLIIIIIIYFILLFYFFVDFLVHCLLAKYIYLADIHMKFMFLYFWVDAGVLFCNCYLYNYVIYQFSFFVGFFLMILFLTCCNSVHVNLLLFFFSNVYFCVSIKST